MGSLVVEIRCPEELDVRNMPEKILGVRQAGYDFVFLTETKWNSGEFLFLEIDSN